MAQPGIGFLAIGLGRLNQTVDLCASGGALGCGAELPVLAPDDERPDGVFGAVVVDRQVAVLDVANQRGGAPIGLRQLRSVLWPAVQAAGFGVTGLYRAMFGNRRAGADQLRPRLRTAPAQQPDPPGR